MTTQSVLITGWSCPARLLEPLAAAMRETLAGKPLLIDFHDLPCEPDISGIQDAARRSPAYRSISCRPPLCGRRSFAATAIRSSVLNDVNRPDYVEGVRRSLADVECPLMLIGWSTGALIALEFAIRHPDQVAQLVLMSATARFTTATDYPAGVPMEQVDSLAAAIQSDKDRERALTRFMAQSALPQRLDRITLRKRVEAALNLGPEALLAGLHYLWSTDLRDSVETIRCPVRIWHGADDAVIPVAAAEWLARQLPTADLHIEPEAGHDWPVQNPDALAQWMQ